jgi:hypothetical protein
MNHATHCKFCHKPITIEISDEYEVNNDPLKILPLASCNRCADIRVERRRLEDKVRVTAMTLAMAGKHRTAEVAAKTRTVIEKLLKDYANLICRWHYLSGMTWDDAAVDTVMEHPDKWPDVLKTLWQIFRDANKERSAALRAAADNL